MKRKLTKYVGVYEREAQDRLWKGKPDICYDYSYKFGRKKILKKAGWLSAGFSAKLAANLRAEEIRELRIGDALPKKTNAPLLKEVWEKYFTWAQTNLSRAGLDDKSRYENHIEKFLGDKRLSEISTFHLERLKSNISKAGLAPASVKQVLVLIRQLFNKAIIWGLYTGGNPTKGLRMPKVDNMKLRYLSIDEAEILLEALAAKSQKLHDIALMSLHLGLRFGEIASLTWDCVNWDAKTIAILNAKAGSRTGYLTTRTFEMLKRRKQREELVLKRRKAKDKLEGQIPSESELLIFPKRSGTAGSMSQASKVFTRTVEELKLNQGITDRKQKITYHSLRHTFATHLYSETHDLYLTQRSLGHTTPAMTQRYAKMSESRLREGALAIQKVFDENAAKKEPEQVVNLT